MLVYQQNHVSMHWMDVMEPMLAKRRLIFVTKTTIHRDRKDYRTD